MLLRSLLFTPGNRPRLLEKAAGRGADAVILDLEDSVPPAEKEAARVTVRRAVETIGGAGLTPVFVRINAAPDLAALDLPAVVCPQLTGVMVPKVQSVEDVINFDGLLREMELAQDLPPARLRMLLLLETARGVLQALPIAEECPPRVIALALGAADLALDLGIDMTRDETEILYARSHLALASRAAGLEPPLDAVYPDLQDEEGLVRSARLARSLGFQGKLCVHPAQIAPVNAAFSPDEAEVARARRVVEAFDAAVQAGQAAAQLDGRLIDPPIAASARRLLERAAAIAQRPAAG